MIYFSNKHRSLQEEIMDDLQLQGTELEKLLTDLKIVNTLLGGNSITINGVSKLITAKNSTKTIRIMDLGCGDGEILRQLAVWGEAKGYTLQLLGVDANPHILKEAKNRSKGYKNLTFKRLNVFSNEEPFPEVDISLCTLFIHHFENEKIIPLISKLEANSKLGVVINDLQRSKVAFNLFRLFSLAFLKTKIAKFDGLVSVARSFKKEELLKISEEIKGSHQIKWKWAFRYQWVIKSSNQK